MAIISNILENFTLSRFFVLVYFNKIAIGTGVKTKCKGQMMINIKKKSLKRSFYSFR